MTVNFTSKVNYNSINLNIVQLWHDFKLNIINFSRTIRSSTVLVHIVRSNVITMSDQTWSPSITLTSDHYVRSNVITLYGQMWSHCPGKCGHTARSTVVTLSDQLWSHWPIKCDHTDLTNAITLIGQGYVY